MVYQMWSQFCWNEFKKWLLRIALLQTTAASYVDFLSCYKTEE